MGGRNKRDPRGSARGLLAALVGFLAAVAAPAHPEIDQQIARMSQEIAAHPDDPALFLRRGELSRIHQDWPAAEADFRTAARLAPDLAIVDFHLGRLQLDAGKLDEARRSLDRFIARTPGEAEALAVRARVLEDLKLPEAAAADLTAAIAAVGPDDRPKPSYYLDRARVLAATGKVDLAVQGLDEGLARLGQPVTLELYAIELELGRKRYDAALTRLARIAAKSERQETWLVRRAEILEQAGRKQEARAAYEGAIEAIRALPAARRTNRAVSRLEAASEAGLVRLGAVAPPTVPAPGTP